MTFDPTYPLLPVFSIFSAALLAVVLISSTVRQSWNIGISVLCFWVGLENLVNGVGEVIWRNNADIKLEVWCDIGELRCSELPRRRFLLLTPAY